jgi:hypothetical protein
LTQGNRDAHIDHLVGGSNVLGNLVLACRVCNGDEKRDEHWESFLRKKATDPETFEARRQHIRDWIAACGPYAEPDSIRKQKIGDEVSAVIGAFDAALERIRRLRDDEVL